MSSANLLPPAELIDSPADLLHGPDVPAESLDVNATDALSSIVSE